MATVVRTVKVLALRLDNRRLDVVINFMKCFPCVEKLYIKVTFLLLFSLQFFLTFLLLQICCSEAWFNYSFSDICSLEKHTASLFPGPY